MSEALQFRIHGMDCADEVALLRGVLVPVVGSADRLQFDILRGKMTVTAGDPAVTGEQIEREVKKTGLRAEVWAEQPPERKDDPARQLRTMLTTACGLLALGAFGWHASQAGVMASLGSEGAGQAESVPILSILLYSLAILAGGWHIAPRAWFALRRLRPDMNLLMAIAVVGAIGIGEWFEAATVTFLFAVSLTLEAWSVGRARRAVEALLAIAPPTARVLAADGTQSEVAAADVTVGTIILAKPGDRIALDGKVRTGSSQVNQAPITGESMPVDKEPGADVFAGTINGSGALEIEVTRLAGETTLAQIIRMVGEAQSRRAPSEQWVDRFARVYTPVILALAVAVAVVPVMFGGSFGEWFYRALVLLVIGCPCALVISTPVSIVASLTSAARNGVLVKGGAFIEAPGKLRVVALDKTGTLTEGRPRVVEVKPLGTHTAEELLRSAAAIESSSDHPLARAIVAYAAERKVAPGQATGVRAVDGRGVTASIDGKRYWLGSHRYLEELGQETPSVHDQLEAMSAPGRTAVIVGTDDHVCGFFGVADATRPESIAAIREMKRLGVEHVVMLTGDNRATADNIARETGVDDVRAELLPADKVSAVENLVRQYGTVAMIGDGVNDAPAMGRATIGIAMGAVGSDAAIEAADIALMSDDLSKLPWLIAHSRRTLGIIRQNVVLSLGVKVLFLGLTMFGSASLWSAIAADMGVSLLVVMNALRLLR
jgi:Cd2+/Zn2+-exporting ATPase